LAPLEMCKCTIGNACTLGWELKAIKQESKYVSHSASYKHCFNATRTIHSGLDGSLNVKWPLTEIEHLGKWCFSSEARRSIQSWSPGFANTVISFSYQFEHLDMPHNEAPPRTSNY